MLLKYCNKYASKSVKLSRGHRTGKGQFSFQSQRKTIPKNVQTTAQLHSSHTITKYCSKFSKSGFNSMWTMNFQMFKLDLEKAEEPEIKLPTSVGSLRKQESSRKTSISALLTVPNPFDCVDHNRLWKILQERGIPDYHHAFWEICMKVKKQHLELDMEQQTGSNGERSTSRLHIVTLLI